MIFSKRTYFVLILAALLLAVSAWVSVLKTIAIVIDVLFAILLFVDFQITTRPTLINGTREIADRLSIGRDNNVKISVTSLGTAPLDCLARDEFPENMGSDVREFVFRIQPGQVSHLDYNVLPNRRGAYNFGDINVRYRSAFGLFYHQVKIPAARAVKVFSDMKALHDLSIKLSRSSELGELQQRRRGQGTDFSSLKEYTVGDDAKSIDWKATARRDRPVVRTYEAEQEQRMLILIDAGRTMTSDLEGLTRFDHALNAALCLALTGLSHNDQVGFGIFADRPLAYLPPRRGKGYLKNILEVSFDVEPKMVEPDYIGMLSHFATMQKSRCLFVLLTDLTDPTGSQALLSGLASLAPRHLPFCVTLEDRQINAVALTSGSKIASANMDDNLEAIYKRAIATDLLAQRELALSVLQRRGCLILDCPPQELSDKLVDAYLDIKTRAKL
ncbi:MAG: DUF58 domain-containing protein [Candidatus Obscuribacterales bacterium]|nr:DUF58 domain-containing protein [Candidatus Obscuribacterales bacterium]